MLSPSSNGADKFQALFLGYQSGDAGTHLTDPEYQYANWLAPRNRLIQHRYI